MIGKSTFIDGQYYTVNPQAIRTTLDVYGENVRKIVPIESPQFGTVMTVWVGAMSELCVYFVLSTHLNEILSAQWSEALAPPHKKAIMLKEEMNWAGSPLVSTRWPRTDRGPLS